MNYLSSKPNTPGYLYLPRYTSLVDLGLPSLSWLLFLSNMDLLVKWVTTLSSFLKMLDISSLVLNIVCIFVLFFLPILTSFELSMKELGMSAVDCLENLFLSFSILIEEKKNITKIIYFSIISLNFH